MESTFLRQYDLDQVPGVEALLLLPLSRLPGSPSPPPQSARS